MKNKDHQISTNLMNLYVINVGRHLRNSRLLTSKFMKWIVIATPSPFRDYLISAIPTADILVIYESCKEASVEYDTFVDFETNLYSKFLVEPNINIKY